VDFMLPAGTTVDSAKIEVVGDRPLLLVKSGSRMFYSYEMPTQGWTTVRSITLDAATDERSAEILLRTMLEATARLRPRPSLVRHRSADAVSGLGRRCQSHVAGSDRGAPPPMPPLPREP
jgi:hypothetical protein